MCISLSFLTRDKNLAGLALAQQMEKPHFFPRSKSRLMQKVMVADDYARARLGRVKAGLCMQTGVIFTTVQVMGKAN